MHGQVGAAFFQGHFQFFDEEAFATHFGQGPIQDLVAFGGHAKQVNLTAKALAQQSLNVVRLPESETAFSGGDDPRTNGTRGLMQTCADAISADGRFEGRP